MSKRLISSIIILCVSALLYAAATFIQPFFTGLNLSQPNVNRLEEQIEKRLEKNRQCAINITDQIDGRTADEVFDIGVRLHQKLFAGSSVQMMIFRNDSLLFWTSNLDFMPDTANVQVRVIKKDSDYYLSQCFRNENFRFVFLTSFYVEYPYQNKYLTNGFSPEFIDIKDYNVSQELVYGAVPVRAKGVEPFFLVPIDTFKQKSYINYKPFIQWFSVILFYLGIFLLLSTSYFKKKPALHFGGLLVAILGGRALGLINNFPEHTGGQLFGPELFAHTAVNPSLGDFFVNAVLLFIAAMLVYRFAIAHSIKLRSRLNWFFATVFAMVIWSFFAIVDDGFVSLVLHSTLQLEAYRIFNINIYSIVAYVSLAFLIAAALLVIHTWFRLFYKALQFKKSVVVLLSTYLILCLLGVFIESVQISVYGYILSLLIVATYLLRGKLNLDYELRFSWFTLLMAVISLYSVVQVSTIVHTKDENIRRVLAVNLSSERDPLAELLLSQMSQKLYSDALVRHYVRDIETYNTDLYEHLRKDFFKDYLNKYDLRATVCQQNDDEEEVSYNDFFSNLIDTYGALIPSSRFYHINAQNGIISYLGVITYRFGNDVKNLYIELDSRPSWEMLGYPELLIEGQNPQRKLYGYSYAKYHQGKLVNQGGDYQYQLNFRSDSSTANSYYEFNQGGFSHVVYNSTPEDAILVSRPLEEPLNTTASFVYNLVFFVLIVALLLKMSRKAINFAAYRKSYKNKMKWAMVLIVVLSMLLVATATIIYSVRNFEQRIQKNLGEKLMSVTLELYNDIPLLENIDENRDELTNRLIDLSNVFYTDINIYDTTGMLVITSRPEIFDKDLMGERMNYRAWDAIYFKKSQKFVERESIGGANFQSAYVPIIGVRNEPMAYLNLPYFTKEEELKNELYSIVIAIINIYALLLLLAVIIAMVISSQITRPLELIRDKIRRVDISSHNDLIEYTSNDEVGQLIGEYNRMVQELDKSATELAKNQRENAWREMARQVAHEVKNPLTPIKLSLQYLVKAKKEGAPEWDEMFARFAQSLDEQVNTLSRIASEFSAFAKLPMAKLNNLNLLQILNDVMTVFSGYNESNINIVFDNKMDIVPTVRADRDQLIRVFNNLVLNAIQSIEKGKKGEVRVVLSSQDGQSVMVEVIDNGSGIEPDVLPKLFSPNFTTKSSGTGLGLAISREIVETFGGKINVKCNADKGATFFVVFPLQLG